jgi:choline kinase
MNNNDTSIIICCAGMGTRLGIGTTKALVNVLGTPVIIRLLHELSEYDDIRIIVGYQAESVIERVNKVRKDVMFAFN